MNSHYIILSEYQLAEPLNGIILQAGSVECLNAPRDAMETAGLHYVDLVKVVIERYAPPKVNK
jgi:hypothetical protein